jgi:Spy/CpxP family protein refolding chaperone
MNKNSWRLLALPGAIAGSLLAFAAPAVAQTTSKPNPKASRPKPAAELPDAPPAPISDEAVAARANPLTASMAQALSLTPAQTEKVRDINAKSVRKVEAARQRYAGQPSTKLRGAIEDIGLARLEQLKDVLTPAQFGRYQQKREEKLGVPTVRGYQGTPPPSLGSRSGEE